MVFLHILVYAACAWIFLVHGLTTNKTSGTAYFNPIKDDQWTLISPKGRDVMLLLNVVHLKNYRPTKQVFLPDGSVLAHNDIEYNKPSDAWCGIYVPANSKACQAGKVIPDICNKTVNASARWPPNIRIQTRSSMFIFFTYTFFPCATSEGTDLTKPTQNTDCDPMTGTFAILGVLLAISVILSAALLFKSIREKQRHLSPKQNKPPSGGQATQPQTVRENQRAPQMFTQPIDDTYQMPVFKDQSNNENSYQGLNHMDTNLVYNQLAH